MAVPTATRGSSTTGINGSGVATGMEWVYFADGTLERSLGFGEASLPAPPPAGRGASAGLPIE